MAKHAPHQVQFENRAHPQFIRPSAVALAVAACFSSPVLANPTNPIPIAGIQQIQGLGTSALTITTNAGRSIINWGSFSIGLNELTQFIQPSALSAVLNRVTGQNPSEILGALQSNGKVFLLNPNGIVFGSGAQINVAGLVASTLKLSDDDFLNNRMKFTDGAGAGSVVNNGSITGGNVYLVGNAVTNNGLISSPNGEVVLAAGNSVELVNPGTPNLRVEIVAPANEARNLGTITAEAGRIGIYAGLIKQGGTLSADSAVSEGGRIILKSTKKTVLEEGSLTSARGTSGGQILALSNMTNGATEVAGKLDASGTAGNGGFIETSAATVNIADSAVVTAAGGGGGKAGTWLIDPLDFYISAYGGNITGSTLATQLDAYGGTNVTFSTAGYGGDVGNLYVNDTVSWNSTGALTLLAHNNVEVNNAISNGGTGGVSLYAGWDGGSTTTPVVGSGGAINLNAPISTLGDIKLVAGGDIVQGAPGSLTAAGLLAVSNNGMVSLDNAGAVNTVSTLAGSANSSFAFKNSGALTIGTVGSVSGITVSADTAQPASINVNVFGGPLTIANDVVAYGGDGAEGAGGSATITLTSNNGIVVNANVRAYGGWGGSYSAGGQGGAAGVTLNNTGAASSLLINGQITADGGEGGYAWSSGTGGTGGNAAISLLSSGGLSINSLVRATGGDGGSAYTGNGGRGGDGVVDAIVAGILNIAYGGSVLGRGGRGGDAEYGGSSIQAGRGGDGRVTMLAGSITVASGGVVQGVGGDGGGSSYSYGGGLAKGGDAGDALVQLTSSGNISVMGEVSARGGLGGEGGEGGSYAGNGGNAALSLHSTGGAITISGGEVYAEGGEGPYYAVGTNGGNATVTITSAGATTISSASVYANGGDGGEGGGVTTGGTGTVTVEASGPLSVSSSYVYAYGGDGGESGLAGSAAVNLISSGGITISSNSDIYTYGGNGRSGTNGGNATTTVQADGGDVLIDNSSEVYASGGYGDYYATVGNGGTGVVNIGSAGSTAIINSYIYANGGYAAGYSAYGGSTAGGGNATILISAGGGLTLTGSTLNANGGNADAGQGGAAGITMLAGGNIQFEGAEGRAYGGNSNTGVGGDASILMAAGGNIVLDSNFYSYEDTLSALGGGNTPGMKSVTVAAAGTVSLINGASVYSSGGVLLGGANIVLDNSYASAGTGIQVDASGNLDLMNDSYLSSGGSVFVTTGGNVTVDNSHIFGSPEVFMKVGGSIGINNGGTIEAGSPSTIFLTFPMLTSGGYSVNGIDGVIYDPLTHTGFVVLGNPAILGTNLHVTYGGGSLTVPTDALIVAMGESSKPPDPEKDKNVFEDIEEGKKKDAPVCR